MNSKEISNSQSIDTFFAAIRSGNITVVNHLVNNDLLNIIHPTLNVRPIDEAIRYRQINILKYLLYLGVDSKLQNPVTLLTPLSLAQNIGDPETISLLRCHIHTSNNKNGKNGRQEDNNLRGSNAKRQKTGEHFDKTQVPAYLPLPISAEISTQQPNSTQVDRTRLEEPVTFISKTCKPSTVDAVIDAYIQVHALFEEAKQLHQEIQKDRQHVSELKREIEALRVSLQIQQNQTNQQSPMVKLCLPSRQAYQEYSSSSRTQSFFKVVTSYPNENDENYNPSSNCSSIT